MKDLSSYPDRIPFNALEKLEREFFRMVPRCTYKTITTSTEKEKRRLLFHPFGLPMEITSSDIFFLPEYRGGTSLACMVFHELHAKPLQHIRFIVTCTDDQLGAYEYGYYPAYIPFFEIGTGEVVFICRGNLDIFITPLEKSENRVCETFIGCLSKIYGITVETILLSKTASQRGIDAVKS